MTPASPVPAYALYGEEQDFPDILHAERITDRAGRHDWTIAAHRHGGLHQLFVLTAGTAEMIVGAERMVLELPVAVSMPRSVVHGFRFAQGTEGHVVSLPRRACPELHDTDNPLGQALARWGLVPATGAIVALVRRIEEEHGAADPLRDTMLKALVLALATRIARGLSLPAGHAPRSRAEVHMARFDRLVREHLRDDWSIADYARALDLSPQQLSRVTHAVIGQSASRHVEARLFQEARRLLAYTRMGVAEVGYALGFNDPAYFSRAFRRHVGASPSDYRAGIDRAQGRPT
ncbi:helix-turn-helix domain-containing protein [Roseivivax isoporae]|nr:helix-turn-helix domain-containing protein [Roseivivax isoporae]